MARCIFPANIFRFRGPWRGYCNVTAGMWPSLPVIGQRPPSDRFNVPMYGCYSRVQQYCYHVTATNSPHRPFVPVWNNTKRYVILSCHWIVNISVCYSPIDAIELGLAWFTTQIVWHSHPGIRRASWVVKQSQWRSTGCHPYYINGTATSQRCQIRNRHEYLTLLRIRRIVTLAYDRRWWPKYG